MIREKEKNNREEFSLIRLLDSRRRDMPLKIDTSFTSMLLNVWIIHSLEQKIIQ